MAKKLISEMNLDQILRSKSRLIVNYNNRLLGM